MARRMSSSQHNEAVHPDDLFLRVLDDLRVKTTPPYDEYELLRAAGLLRLLLIDGNRLVAVVNRDRRLKHRFLVRRPIGVTATTNQWLAIGPVLARDPRYPTQPTEFVNLDQLLKREAMQVSKDGDHWRFTVHDIIGFACHVLGGVHYGAPEGDADHRLMEVIEYDPPTEESGYARSRTLDFVRSTLLQVSTVVIEGLQPVVEAIRGRA